MKKTSIFIILLSTFTFNFCHAATQENEELFLGKMANSIDYIDQHQKEVWPGYKMSATPTIIHFPNEHYYALNFNPINPNWQKVIINNKPVYFLDHDEYDIKNIPIGFGTVIDHQPAYLITFSNDADDLSNLYVGLHERFHWYQFQTFSRDNFPQETYIGFNLIENVKLSFLEIETLKDYLLTSNIESLKEYVAINQYREQLMGDESSRYESHKEDVEGTATYVGMNTFSTDDKQRKHFLIKDYQERCPLSEIIKCAIHDRYYFTGAIIGVALDQLSPIVWKENLNKKGISLRDQLYRFFPMTSEERIQQITNAKIRFHFDDVTKPVEVAMIEYQQELVKEQNNFNHLPGSLVHIDHLSCQQRSSNVSTIKRLYIDSDHTLNITGNGKMACSDGSIEINFNRMPYYYESSDFIVEFKTSSNATLMIDGKEFMLQDFINRRLPTQFHAFSLTSDTSNINANRPGILEVQDNKLIIKM